MVAEFNLIGAIDSGPLARLSFHGSMADDTGAVVASFNGDISLCSVTLCFAGQTCSLANADVAPAAALADGVFPGWGTWMTTSPTLRCAQGCCWCWTSPRPAVTPAYRAWALAQLAAIAALASAPYPSSPVCLCC